jgi:menaquinone-dependent protoporphyrinogen oxidase
VRILISAASRHGSTRSVADALGAALAEGGVQVHNVPPDEVTSTAGYDAVIVGSAVYAGQWLKPARELVERHADELRGRPVWLFSSGPLGDPPAPADDPVDASRLTALVTARGHRVFAGSLERERLNLAERAIVRVVRAPYGDFRDWQAVRQWASEIVSELGVPVYVERETGIEPATSTLEGSRSAN